MISLGANASDSVKQIVHSHERKMQSTDCTQKEVQVYKFCIRGDSDIGPHSEHKIRFDGQHYFPNRPSDCDQYPNGYCSFQEGACHMLKDAPWVSIENFKSLTVGTERHTGFGDEGTFANMAAAEWNTASCEPYEVVMARDFKSEQEKKICWNIDLSIPFPPIGRKRDLECNIDGNVDSGGIDLGVDCCHTWVEPAESYIWYMKVSPKTFEYKNIRSSVIRNYCMDVPESNTHNGNELIIHQCHTGSNQLFGIDSDGYMRSRLNPEKCLDVTGPSTAKGTPVQVWDCIKDYPFQKWEMTDDGQIRSLSDPSKCMGMPESMTYDFMGMSMPRTVFNGNGIYLMSCNEDSSQKWFF